MRARTVLCITVPYVVVRRAEPFVDQIPRDPRTPPRCPDVRSARAGVPVYADGRTICRQTGASPPIGQNGPDEPEAGE
jgi:hypothetical protein